MIVEKLLTTVVDACDDKHGYDIVVYDMKEAGFLYDYAVVCHAPTNRQVEAIASEVKEKVLENDGNILNIEGWREAKWILLDLGDIIVNVMTRDDREYYALDSLFEKYPIKEV
ncbi:MULTISPECIES: ribosome silencing factor [unclassified Gemella]|uniref:ribosome silencing factor n=1 Tax=unclassified Gemella TaxID=2624949 RepID=UPI0010730751|nr:MULTISPECIES: ribosome silencing factor [unclassified Gemella]MBF0710719.1 ribosome silencing factor [Gemella sp. GL1.1]MBF0746712.1 ribosome silencing factor [Gemella sp. 19428wG2_WT2a]NYS28063.1 ribosome silencing factor [Gemella sp. GL1]TFU60061.1 ribosome silencing factor [Gemella sp. WT2a]